VLRVCISNIMQFSCMHDVNAELCTFIPVLGYVSEYSNNNNKPAQKVKWEYFFRQFSERILKFVILLLVSISLTLLGQCVILQCHKLFKTRHLVCFEVNEEHYCVFRRHRSTADKILCICQILEKKWECNGSVICRLLGSL
jgi:hypothetical protein